MHDTLHHMQQFSALSLFLVGRLLEEAQNDCLIASCVRPGDEPLFNMSAPLDARAIEKALKVLKVVEQDCTTLGLTIARAHVVALITKLSSQSARYNFQWLSDQLVTVRDLMVQEMRERVYVYIPPQQAKFFSSKPVPYLFGEEVHRAFPSAYAEIAEAGACSATLRATGSVFHTMRVMEHGLAALGAPFGVSLEHTTWAVAIEQIERKIRDMHKDEGWKGKGNVKDLQAKYAQIASTFGILKDAWRNHTMHGTKMYTQSDAEHIFSNAKVFMQGLAKLGMKEAITVANSSKSASLG